MNEMHYLERRGCKNHPNDNKVPGVCSFCLRDKLSLLNNYNNINNNNLIDCPSSCSPQGQPPFSPPTNASSNHATLPHVRRLGRNASHATNHVSCMISFKHELNLKKSKSHAFASRTRIRERDVGGVQGRKKDGFWSKVIKLTKKDSKEASINSRIVRGV
ncbi:hypothetical protein TanjilG_16773 [Lupinus angustifolius]|uniref:Uncharacterized protein n=1 Tax=Lupinus angustifolius TaxID=3871 RepID=A0A4P1QZQ6_LUPAN|nr:PREDICTED: uncharacterized protein LOC109326481 [Lupinus angustifolius]OIV98446.1 hypothetical protein TanjilG_16773 [Lupinus angustifolius]